MKPIQQTISLPQYFDMALTVLKPLPPFNRLKNKELKVLAQLLYYAYKYKQYPKEEKFKLIFDYDTKAKIAESLNIPMTSLANNITSLRAAGIVREKTIDEKFLLDPKKDPTITFKFNIKEHE